MRVSGRHVIQNPLRRAPCPVSVNTTKTQNANINIMGCCVEDQFHLCIDQSSDKPFTLTDAETVDFTAATEIVFGVWQGGVNGTPLLSYSLTGGEISLIADNVVAFTIPNADSGTLPPGRHHAELWVVTPGPIRLDAVGTLTVRDTRNFDA